MSQVEIEQAMGLIIDPDPDERGNLIAVAMVATGAMIAVALNAN